MTADNLFTELYKASVLIERGVMNPGEVFPHIHTDNQVFDTFFANFWNVAGEPGFEEKITAQCALLTAQHPSFAFVQHVVGIWLYSDFNAFHYGLREVSLLYLLVEADTVGVSLNEKARLFIQTSSLAAAKDVSLSHNAFLLVEKFLAPEQSREDIPVSDAQELFPDISVAPYAFSDVLQRKITESRLATGAEYDVESIAHDVGWYCSVIAYIRNMT